MMMMMMIFLKSSQPSPGPPSLVWGGKDCPPGRVCVGSSQIVGQ
jgi:hypothetical protein